MKFTFAPMTETVIIEMQSWQFSAPYTLYNLAANLESNRAEMLDQLSPYYAVRDEQAQLVGYFCFGTSAEPWDHEKSALYNNHTERALTVGLGMRPDLTGQGLGATFIDAGLAFARDQFQPDSFKLYVLSFNQRAIRAYERAGFTQIGTFSQQNTQGISTFLVMERQA
jgi:[ribosomal protein S18]-alanine N-acetyltransferase